jgi:hypothetical protein
MSRDFESIFNRLRAILQKHAGTWRVADDKADHYCLEGNVGPATLRASGGKAKKPMIPVAWVKVGKAYVSFHLMGLYGNTKLCEGLSNELKARMQGKTCFNFKSSDDELFRELDQLTPRVLAAFSKAGYAIES